MSWPTRLRTLCRLMEAFAPRTRTLPSAAEDRAVPSVAERRPPRRDWFTEPFTLNDSVPEDVRAEARARALLIRLLAPAQREELERRDSFTVQVPGRGRFAILPRRTLNVLDLDTGECYCCVTAANVPLSDLMLAQKLLLELDPEQFFATANCPSDFLFSSVTGGGGFFGRRQRSLGRAAGAPANGPARRILR